MAKGEIGIGRKPKMTPKPKPEPRMILPPRPLYSPQWDTMRSRMGLGSSEFYRLVNGELDA